MIRNWMYGAVALTMMASPMMVGGAMAQNVVVPDAVTTANGPAASVTQTEHSVDAIGTQVDKSSNYSQSQSYSSGNGELSARTSTQTNSNTTVTTPPSTTTYQTRTTTETVPR